MTATPRPAGPRRRIVFHIGLEKTGTTSFQRFCLNNQAALLRQGLLYPRRIVGRGINHKLLAASYVQDRPKDRALALRVPPRARLLRTLWAEAEASDAATILISAEHLSSRFDPAAIAALARDFSAFDVVVLVTVRDHEARLVSSYTSYVQGGGRDRFPAYAARAPLSGSVRETLDPWLAVFGRERMRVLDYDAEPDMIPALLRACGVSLAAADTIRPRDLVSLQAGAVQTVAAVNRAITARQTVAPDESDMAWLQLIALSVLLRKRTIGAAATLGPRVLALDPQDRAGLAAIIERDRAWLHATFGLTTVVVPHPAAPPRGSDQDLDPERLAQRLVEGLPGGLWWLSDALVGLRPGFDRCAARLRRLRTRHDR